MRRSHPHRPSEADTFMEALAIAPRESDPDAIPYGVYRSPDGAVQLETDETPPQRATWTRSGPTRFSTDATPAFRALVADFRRRNG